jgi:CubicO group peptidase (beta-lactamase class C family)
MTIPRSRFDALTTARDVAHAVVEARVADACAAGWAKLDEASSTWIEDAAGALTTRVDEGEPDGRPLDRSQSPEEVLFDLASLTKPMLAVSLAKSAIDRRTPLREVLAEAVGTASGDAPLERLVAHRAGLEANLSIFQRLREDASPAARRALFAWAAGARRAGCEGEPPPEGFPALYSDLGYLLAGEAIARARGADDAGAVIRELVVEPLGLAGVLGTARDLSKRNVDVVARAAPTEIVGWRGGAVRGRVHDENAWMLTGLGGSGHAGMFGTVRAVLAFGGHVFERRDELHWTWAPRSGGTLRAGFDGKSEDGSSAGSVLGARSFGHLGFTGTSVWIDPDARVVVALLTNRVHPTRDSTAIRATRPLAHDALARIARGA